MSNNEITKNLLRGKICRNCKYRVLYNTTSWCYMKDYEPSRGTCTNWKKLVFINTTQTYAK